MLGRSLVGVGVGVGLRSGLLRGGLSLRRLCSASGSDGDDLEEKLARPPERGSQSLRPPRQPSAGEEAVEAVASLVQDSKERGQVRSELLSRLQEVEGQTQPEAQGSAEDMRELFGAELNQLLAGMTMETSGEERRRQWKRGREAQAGIFRAAAPGTAATAGGRGRPARPSKTGKPAKISEDDALGDYFSRDGIGPGLAIFADDAVEKGSSQDLRVWATLEGAAVRKLLDHGPRDGFDEAVRWTEAGKLWPLPIDNDWRCPEAEVGFEDHVLLLERLGEMNFPDSGPIRDFMEIIAIGLSKNPYMSADKKARHLHWFEEYFAKKADFIHKLQGPAKAQSPSGA